MRKVVIAGIVLLALAGIGAVSAQNLVKNGGFELPALGEGTGFVECPPGALDDWDIGGVGIDHIRAYWKPSEGDHSLDMSQLGSGSVSQLVPTTAGGIYMLSFDMAGNPECGPVVKRLMVYWGAGPGYGPYTHTTTGYPVVGPGGWNTIEISGLPGTAGGTVLRFEDVSTPSSACGVALDNIVVFAQEPAPIPEFPGYAIPVALIIGLLGAVLYIRSSREQ
jgi:hypothetical protein